MKKTSKIKRLIMILPVAGFLVVLMVYALPGMGASVLKYKFLKCLGLLFWGISLLVTSVTSLLEKARANDPYMNPHKETLEEMYETRSGVTDFKGVVVLITGVVFLFIGGSGFVKCVKDAGTGPVRITLESTRIGNGSSWEEDADKRAYDLYGVANLEGFHFRITAEEIDEHLWRKINYRTPQITVVYYPETRAIIQMVIFYEEDDRVVLPHGDRAYDSRSLDKLPEGKGEALENPGEYEATREASSIPTPTPGPFVPMKQEYSEVDAEDLNLPEYEEGKTYLEYARELAELPNGENYRAIWPGEDGYEEDVKKTLLLYSKYELTSKQGARILYKDDIELILIFDSETSTIQKVVARRNLLY